MGQKTGNNYKFDSERAAKILRFLRAGAPTTTAAMAAGVSVVTFRAWLKAGADGRTPDLAKFNRDVDESIGQARVGFMLEISRAGRATPGTPATKAIAGKKGKPGTPGRPGVPPKDGDWRALAWLLERTAPKEFGRHLAFEHTGPDGSAIPIIPAVLVLPANGRDVADDEVEADAGDVE